MEPVTPVDGEIVDPALALEPVEKQQQTSQTLAVSTTKLGHAFNDEDLAKIETAIMRNDFGALSHEQRAYILFKKCEALGVSIWLQPFAWGTIDGKLTPVPLKGLFQQLREKRGLIIDEIKEDFDKELGVYSVKCFGHVGERKDMGIGVVGVKGLSGDPLANAMMKAHTKAKNRLTGSLCGGDSAVDDAELSSIPGAGMGEEKPAGIRTITPGAPGQRNTSSVTPLVNSSSTPPPSPEPQPEQPQQYSAEAGAAVSSVVPPPPIPEALGAPPAAAPDSAPPTKAPIKVGSSAPAGAPGSAPKKPLLKAT